MAAAYDPESPKDEFQQRLERAVTKARELNLRERDRRRANVFKRTFAAYAPDWMNQRNDVWSLSDRTNEVVASVRLVTDDDFCRMLDVIDELRAARSVYSCDDLFREACYVVQGRYTIG